MVPRNSKSNYGSKLSNKNSWPLYLAIVAVCVGGIGYFVEVAHYEVLLLCDITYYLSLDLVTSLMSGGTSPAPIGTISQVDTLYFKTYDFALNDANNWDWASPNSTTIRRACTKKFTNLCILINATTPGFIIEYKHQQYNFLNDNDFTQFDMTYPLQSIIPQPQPQASIINRRQLSDINNMHMDAARWGVFKKLWKGVKAIGGAIGSRMGLYLRPPCSSESQCRVHLYNSPDFRKRSNTKGHFCEGRWGRLKLLRYGVRRRRISSIKVQGSPCCVAIAYNGDRFDGDLQAMYPRGRYRSMTMGLSTGMGTGNGWNGMDHPMMAMMGGGLGMNGANKEGFKDKKLASLRIVHDCRLMQTLLHRAMHGHGGGMHGGMHGGMMSPMAQMMQMMQMMSPHDRHRHASKRRNKMCRYYSCIVKTQQSQLQQLMQSMMMTAMANQAPITITDNTKAKPGRRRMITQQNNSTSSVHPDMIGVNHAGQFGKMGFPSLSDNSPNDNDKGILLNKCMMVHKNEICGMYNFKDKSIVLRYIIADTYKINVLSDMNMNDKDNDNDNDNDKLNVNHYDYNLLQLYMLNEWYGIWRNSVMFDHQNNIFNSSDAYAAYVDEYDFKTVIWSDIESELECNDLLLSVINYTICIEQKDLMIYFKNTSTAYTSNNEQNGDITKAIKSMYKESKLSILNDMNWNEIYRYQNSNHQILCKFMAIIKLCVTVDINHMKISQISVQFISIV